MSDVSEYIKRVAEKTKHRREFYVERNVPTTRDNLLAIPFYGDLSSTFVLSSLLLRTYKDQHPDKYLVLCSWPGFQGLFPFVDEYWCIDDNSVSKTLALEANNFYNASSLATELHRNLFECLDVMNSREFLLYYNKGFTEKYWSMTKSVNRFLPEVPSGSRLSDGFRQQLTRLTGRKVFVYPVTRMQSWQGGKLSYLPVSQQVWSVILERLIEDGFSPIVYQNWFTYDMSPEFADRCVYLVTRDVSDVLAAMRFVGLVLDVHSGISRLAIAARCPYFAVDERLHYVGNQEFVIDDLCGMCIPKRYVFSFSTYFMTGGPKEWKTSVIDIVSSGLKKFVTELGEDFGDVNESYGPVSYEAVRIRKARRMGVHFIRASKNR